MDIKEYTLLSNIKVVKGTLYIKDTFLKPHESVKIVNEAGYYNLQTYLKKFDVFYNLHKFPYLDGYYNSRSSMELMNAYKSLLSEFFPGTHRGFEIDDNLLGHLEPFKYRIWDRDAKKRIQVHRGPKLPYDFEVEADKMVAKLKEMMSLPCNAVLPCMENHIDNFLLENIDVFYRRKSIEGLLAQESPKIIALVGEEHYQLFQELAIIKLKGGNIHEVE